MNDMKKKSVVVITLIFPLVLAVGIFTIPYVSDYADHVVVEAAAGQSARWFLGHILSGLAFGVSIIVAHVISAYLDSTGRKTAATTSFCLVTLGAILLAAGLGADGVGPLAARAGGAQASVFFDGSGMMVSGIFMSGIVLFGFGLISQIIGLKHAGLVSKPLSATLIVCAVALMGASAIPSTLGLYVLAVLSMIIYGSISVSFRNRR
jgi:hypothetical protein